MRCLATGLCLLWTTLFCHAQDAREFFTSVDAEVEFIGLDFSEAKMVGLNTKNAPQEIKVKYFKAWNDLLIKEARKYDVKRAFMKQNLSYNFDVVDHLNQQTKSETLLANASPQSFSEKKLQGIVNQYNTQTMKSQYGVSFVIHSFNQFRERAYVYIVIFDVATKEVLFSAQTSGEAGGFGFRNYWARTIYNILEDIRDYKFRRWKEEIRRQPFAKK